MSAEITPLRAAELPPPETGLGSTTGPVHAELLAVEADGLLRVRLDDGRAVSCEWLETAGALAPVLVVGDRVLVLPPVGPRAAVVLGRIGRYQRSPDGASPPTLSLEVSQSLSLRCGDASIDLRADGKVMIRGDDVLVRAKGTQRIRAGTVAIN